MDSLMRVPPSADDGVFVISTESGSKYTLNLATRKLTRYNDSEDLALRKDGVAVDVLSYYVEVGETAVFIITGLAEGVATHRRTTSVTFITEDRGFDE